MASDRTKILGALTWWHHHPDRYKSLFPLRRRNRLTEVYLRLQAQYSSGFPPTNLQAWQDLQTLGIEEDEIITLAAKAEGLGTAGKRLQQRQLTLGGGEVVRVQGFPDVCAQSWWHVDGTILQSDKDNQGRCLRGPLWSSNSCALDCFFAVALLAQAGRCQADQVDTAFLQGIAPLAQVLHAFQKPWATLSASDITQLRDLVRHALFLHSKKDFPETGSAAIYKIFEVLGLGIPQLCATWSAVSRCCERGQWQAHLRSDGELDIRVLVGVELDMMDTESWDVTGLPVEDALYTCLQPSPISKKGWRQLHSCRTEGCSPVTGQAMPILIDRPPPMLLLKRGFEIIGKQQQKDYFQTLEVDFAIWDNANIGRRIKVTYEPLGWVRWLDNHYSLFATRTRGEEVDVIYYDGQEVAGFFVPVASLDDGIHVDGYVAATLYKMKEP